MLKLFSSILFLCFFFQFAPTPTTCLNNETDFHALVAFKKAIQDDPMGSLTSWNETVHFCSWEGILCSSRHHNRVVEIDLMSKGLVGTISPHLGNLSFLQSITLQNNTFQGQIPDEIGNLRRLKLVELSNNSLSGEIPRNLSRCTNIYYLNLIDNNLTGNIPPELGFLERLQHFGLRSNPLSGTIPAQIGNCTRLIRLHFANCGLQGQIPESFVQLKSLEFLFLDLNNLTGTVPSGIYNISTMRSFGINFNALQGTIPSHAGFSSASFKYIGLASNLFTGEIPIWFSNMSSLEMIFLGNNSFTGRIMIDFTELPVLQKFQADFNNFEGDLSFISSMINCSMLTNLVISANYFTGLVPRSIANFSSQLRILYLDGNDLNGSLPPSLGNLVGLEALDLEYNGFDGPIPFAIGKLNELRILMLSSNSLTSNIPFSLGNLTLLSTLSLSLNGLSGIIPQSLANCSYLQTLDISQNNLSGEIPDGILSLSSISLLFNLSHNAFTGPIPSEVGSLMNLLILDVSHNRLSGTIPNSLAKCVGLEELYLQSNSLFGEIPDKLANLRSVRYLDLSANNLSGRIPMFLGGLDLLILNLSFNRLEGEVPTAGVFLNMSAFSLEGNDNLCGGTPSLSFPPCPSTSSEKTRHFPIVFEILIPVVSTGAILLACYYICMYRTSKDVRSSMVTLEADYMRLSYDDLQKSTGGFSESNLLGAGRFGSVYRATLPDMQTSLAVKVLNLHVKGASKSFMSECSALRGIRHRNLVKIVSACSSIDFQGNEFKALVYEFLANGNLDEWLHHESEDEFKTLTLRQRLNIVIDVASAIEYLHFGTGSTIVHGDLKPSNILLDGEMTAHVGDFGLAKVLSNVLSTHDSSSVGIRGTFGYIPPEYGMSGLVSKEGDVYSFGILLLEIFTGRRPTEEEFSDFSSLRDLVRSALPSQVMEIVDTAIQQEYNDGMDSKMGKCVFSVLEIGLACSNEFPRNRMLMTDVVSELQKILNIWLSSSAFNLSM